jgi:hypothetical protein
VRVHNWDIHELAQQEGRVSEAIVLVGSMSCLVRSE